MYRRLWSALLAVVGSAVCAASCGSRSGLLPGEEPCAALGDVRPCENACGVGEQTCEDGIWQSCRVAPASRACTNTCGEGTQVCEDGNWQPCVVPRKERNCEGACGTGTQACEDGRWLECAVPPLRRPCTDACGQGEQTCRNGVWEACEVEPVATECESICGKGQILCIGGVLRPCNAPQPKPPKLMTIVRDFRDTHPDFELPLGGDHLEEGLVLPELGPDDKPVYANRPGSVTTSGAANFEQWFNNAPMINISTSVDLQLVPSPDRPGFFEYRNNAFFPIDNQLFGNEGRNHNFHFTLEASTRFEYRGGEIFSFSGDDDMWVFINRRLAIDLGGIHNARSATVDLDRSAAMLGIVRGQVYPLHLFFAERHTSQSNFVINTSISEPGSCD